MFFLPSKFAAKKIPTVGKHELLLSKSKYEIKMP